MVKARKINSFIYINMTDLPLVLISIALGSAGWLRGCYALLDPIPTYCLTINMTNAIQ
jgi:hypothetical protein